MALQTQVNAALGGLATASPGMVSGMPRFQLDYKSLRVLQGLVSLKSLPLQGNSRFASRLALYFPEVAERIDESDFGILHLEVGALKLATRNAIVRHDWDVVRQHFAFVAKMLEDAGAELRDAFHVSYLGSLLYGEIALNYAKARSLLPKPLAEALMAIEHHYESLVP
jgi:hypothetical protein